MTEVKTVTGEIFTDQIIECVNTFYQDCDFVDCQLVGIWNGFRNCNFIRTQWKVRHSYYHHCAIAYPESLMTYKLHNVTIGADTSSDS